MFVCNVIFATTLAFGSGSPESSESRLEPSYRNTGLVAHVDAAGQLASDQRAAPRSLLEASALLERRLPDHVREVSVEAANAAKARMSTFRDIPGRANALIFSTYFWDEFLSRFTAELPASVLETDRKIIVAEFYESLLNVYALAWGMRAAPPKVSLRDACASYGVNDVTACLKFVFVYTFAKHSGVQLSMVDAAFVYLPQPTPSQDQN